MPTLSVEPRRLQPFQGGREAVLGLDFVREKFLSQDLQSLMSGLARMCGVLLNLGRHQALIRAIDGPATIMVRKQFPRVQYRYTLPYLSNSLDWDDRLDALTSHYVFINGAFRPEFVARAMADTMEVWRNDVDGQVVSVSVQGLCAQTRHREGELTLCCKLGEQAIYKLSFSVIRRSALRVAMPRLFACGQHVIYVGRVQGVSGEHEAIREATALLGDVAPQDLLMAVLTGMAGAMGIHTIFGVNDDACVSQECIQKSASSFRYDQFWDRYGGQPLSGGHVVMTLPVKEKPLSDIASKHRKRTQRKREFKLQVAAQTQASIRSVMA